MIVWAVASWASIQVTGRAAYALTDQDVLWATRMVAFEGGSDPAAVLWTMTQRFALGHWSTFTALIRAYSQPINPLWARGGACCCGFGTCPAGRDYCGTDRCSEARLQRRALASSITWSELERRYPRAVAVTKSWAQAQLKNPVPGAVEFADPTVSAAAIRRDSSMSIVKKAGNWFLATAQSLRWPKDYVTIRLGDRVAGAGSVAGTIAMAVGATVLGFALWRRYH